MIRIDPKDLYQKLEMAHVMYSQATEPDDRLALANYMGNLYNAIICMGDAEVDFSREKWLGSNKKYKKFIKRINMYTDKNIDTFIKNKKFHQDFLSEIIPDVEDEILTILPSLYDDSDSKFSKSDFLEILSDFMKSIGQDELFQKLYKSGNIHSSIIGGSEDNLGFALHNPINQETDIFIKQFRYDMSSLNTLVHELGHAVDLDMLQKDTRTYNQFMYLSIYGEVISRMFERLLFRYLLKNKIKVLATKDKMTEFEDTNHDFLVQAYILSVLDDQSIAKDLYQNYTTEEIQEMIKSYFLEDAETELFVEEAKRNDLIEVFNYVYGDIMSLFLTEKVEKEGLSSEVLKEFLVHRTGPFRKDFLEEMGITPKEYIKKYKREIDLIRK